MVKGQSRLRWSRLSSPAILLCAQSQMSLTLPIRRSGITLIESTLVIALFERNRLLESANVSLANPSAFVAAMSRPIDTLGPCHNQRRP